MVLFRWRALTKTASLSLSRQGIETIKPKHTESPAAAAYHPRHASGLPVPEALASWIYHAGCSAHLMAAVGTSAASRCGRAAGASASEAPHCGRHWEMPWPFCLRSGITSHSGAYDGIATLCLYKCRQRQFWCSMPLILRGGFKKVTV